MKVSVRMIPLLLVTMACLYAQGWRAGPDLVTPRYGASAVVLRGYLFVVGGATGNGVVLNTVERLDPASGSWDATTVAPCNTARLDAAAMVVEDKLYLMGGISVQGDVLESVEVFDPDANTWTFVEHMEKKRRGHIAVPVYGLPCVVGGVDDSGDYEDRVEWFNIGQNKWLDADANIDIFRFKPFAASDGLSKMYLFGGVFNYPVATSYVAEVDIEWEVTWTSLPDMPEPRGNGSSAILGDSILIIGGVTASNTASSRVDYFDIASGQYMAAPDMPAGRIATAAATLNGEAYVIGGYADNPATPLSRVDIFNPLTTAIKPPQLPLSPQEFTFLRGYPNPFNGAVHLVVDIPSHQAYTLEIFNIRGQKIRTLHRGPLSAGEHVFSWDARSSSGAALSSGIYIATLRSNTGIRQLKLAYIK